MDQRHRITNPPLLNHDLPKLLIGLQLLLIVILDPLLPLEGLVQVHIALLEHRPVLEVAEP